MVTVEELFIRENGFQGNAKFVKHDADVIGVAKAVGLFEREW